MKEELKCGEKRVFIRGENMLLRGVYENVCVDIFSIFSSLSCVCEK